jgi:endonuclease-3 related protein
MVGAVLTQNTAWSNVERAIVRVHQTGLTTPEAMLDCPLARLAEAIRPAGYFNLKATRLHHLCRFIVDAGGVQALAVWPTQILRETLLGVHGIGPETADDILLYAFDRPVFVVDAYTRRLGRRLGLLSGDEGYETIRNGVERALGPDTALLRELHALIVAHGKLVCRKRPRCGVCGLAAECPSAGLEST